VSKELTNFGTSIGNSESAGDMSPEVLTEAMAGAAIQGTPAGRAGKVAKKRKSSESSAVDSSPDFATDSPDQDCSDEEDEEDGEDGEDSIRDGPPCVGPPSNCSKKEDLHSLKNVMRLFYHVAKAVCIDAVPPVSEKQIRRVPKLLCE
jgi:hypothetical protein